MSVEMFSKQALLEFASWYRYEMKEIFPGFEGERMSVRAAFDYWYKFVYSI